jgi:hypothetical protein
VRSSSFGLLALDHPPRGDVGEGQQDGGVGAGLVDHLAGVQQHDPAAQAREVVIDLEAVHGHALGDDGLQQHAQGRDVPLAVAQE